MIKLSKKDITTVIQNTNFLALQRVVGKECTKQILEEMLEYKKIEEKLGIDLSTYFKYVGSEKAFVKEDNGTIEECYVIGGTLDSIILMPVAFPYGECEMKREFKDYGSKWALNKEELL